MKWFALFLSSAFALAWACRPQLPPGPAPEYERPVVEPWDAGVVDEDPLANLEAEGEWVDDTPGAAGAAPAGAEVPGRPATAPGEADAGQSAPRPDSAPPATDAGAPK